MMKRLLAICAVVGLALMNATPAMAVTTMTFEEFLGSNGAPLSTFYSGISFVHASSMQEWVAGDATTGLYNVSSWPSGQSWGHGNYWMYGYVFAWTEVSGDDGKIMFDNEDATFFEMGYCSNSTLYLEAYDSGGTLIDSDSGPANLRYINNNPSGPGTVRVDAPDGEFISYVLVYDAGNYWCVDNMSTDASGITIIPAPGAILLGSIGVALVGWLRRKRTL